MSEDLIKSNKSKEAPVKMGAQPDESKQSKGTDWMNENTYKPETPYFQYVIGEFTKLWIPKKQPSTDGAFQPKVEAMLDENKEPVYNTYKDEEGNVTNKVLVRKATWSVLNSKGKTKILGVTVGGGKSLYSKINSRIKEAFKDGKEYLGLKIKKTGSGMGTTYDIETSQDEVPK